MGVPQFGGWDEKTEHTDYSMVFKKARATRKQKKVEVHHVSSKNEELVVPKQHTVVPKQQTVVPKQRTAKEAPIMVSYFFNHILYFQILLSCIIITNIHYSTWQK